MNVSERVHELEKENSELRMQAEFLTKVAAFFGSEASVRDKYQFIDGERVNFPFVKMCAWLGLPLPGGGSEELPVAESSGPAEPSSAPDPGLLAAADGIVARALELAGKRLRSRRSRSERGRLQRVPAASVHTELSVDAQEIDRMRLLEGAWDRVPEIAARYDVDAVCLKETCEDYVRELLVAGVAHEWETTSSVLLRAPCLTDAS